LKNKGFTMFSYEVDCYGYDSNELMKQDYLNGVASEGFKILAGSSDMPLFWNWVESMLKENVRMGGESAYQIAEWCPGLSEEHVAAIGGDDLRFWELVAEENQSSLEASF